LRFTDFLCTKTKYFDELAPKFRVFEPKIKSCIEEKLQISTNPKIQNCAVSPENRRNLLKFYRYAVPLRRFIVCPFVHCQRWDQQNCGLRRQNRIMLLLYSSLISVHERRLIYPFFYAEHARRSNNVVWSESETPSVTTFRSVHTGSRYLFITL